MKKPTLNEIQNFVLSNDELLTEYSERCKKQGLIFHNKLNGGCKVKNRKSGIRKFILNKQYVALSIYNEFKNGTFTESKPQTEKQLSFFNN